mmetsp:Transcript_55988/g.114226  ORF Transcript_55988/g.114226 Transcript_55988/m.114226 type:complete len:161 (+) Transcript_55988:3-485(+)
MLRLAATSWGLPASSSGAAGRTSRLPRPLLAAAPLQRRWRSHPKGGFYGPNYNHFPTEVKLDYPPKDRSDLWKLPDSRRLMFVANGWIYPSGKKGKANQEMTPVLAFGSRNKHNHMDSLTAKEVAAFEALVPSIRAQFAECKKLVAAEEAADALLAHGTR